ncbi:hypothetical protein LV779_36730 [Streptomyces thinghirensis]|nr:hypothetical protein [Streptomyces thinghirensis]
MGARHGSRRLRRLHRSALIEAYRDADGVFVHPPMVSERTPRRLHARNIVAAVREARPGPRGVPPRAVQPDRLGGAAAGTRPPAWRTAGCPTP